MKRMLCGKSVVLMHGMDILPSGIVVVWRRKGMCHSNSSGCWRRRSFTFDCGFIFTPIFFNYCNLGDRYYIESQMAFHEFFNIHFTNLSIELKHVWIQRQFFFFFFEQIVGILIVYKDHWEITKLPKHGCLKYIFERTESTLGDKINFFYPKWVDPVKV